MAPASRAKSRPTPTFFATPERFRRWFDEHHTTAQELWVGFHKRGSGTPSAFARRDHARTGIYAYEQRASATLEPAEERALRANKKALAFFQAQATWYRRTATYWIVSAKRADTRATRLATLIDDSAKERRIQQLTPLSQTKR